MKRWPLTILALFVNLLLLVAQQQEHRPKVAVVLSGGGAKGIAHVGFLKAMEEAGLHPDIIVGTSMGSIVGGFYALGYSADSLATLFRQQDWRHILSNKVILSDVNIEEKKEYGDYIIEFPVKGWMPTLPSGAIKGHELELLFDALSLPAAQDTLFDEYPIAFRAVAVDMLNGQPYVFDRGSLSMAMRSSMSIPTIMEPIHYQNHLFVDGGIVNNFPVDVAQAMGADIIIGVYVGGQYKSVEKLSNIMELLMQTSLLNSINDANKKRNDCHIYIEPPLNDFTAADFNKVDTLLAIGYHESLKYIPEIKAIADSIQGIGKLKSKENYLIDSIKITRYETNPIRNKNTRRMVARLLGSHLGGYVRAGDINKSVNELYGTRLFQKIGYQILPIDSGSYKIVYSFDEAPTRSLDFAFNYSTDNKISLNFHYIMRNFIISGSKLETKLGISEYPAFYARYLKYVGPQNKSSFEVNYDFNMSLMTFYSQGSTRIKEQYKKSYQDLLLAYNFYPHNDAKLTFGMYRSFLKYKSLIDMGFGIPEDYEMDVYNLSMAYYKDTRDDKYFPHGGLKAGAVLLYNLNPLTTYTYQKNDTIIDPNRTKVQSMDADFFQFHFFRQAYHSLGRWTLEQSSNVYLTSNNGLNKLNSFRVGGLNASNFMNIPFWGMPLNYMFSNLGLVEGIGVRWEFYNELNLVTKINGLFMPTSFSSIFTDALDLNHYYLGGGLGLSYNSPIGPVSIILTKNSKDSPVWTYFNIGFYF